MDRIEIRQRLYNLIGDFLQRQGWVLVDLTLRYEGKDLVLRILTDSPSGGITLEDCSFLNTRISEMLDEKDIISGPYILEVSSPGIDRPLRDRGDFNRCLNRKVRFFLKTPFLGKLELEATITKVEEDSVWINYLDSIQKIPLSDINMAKQVLYEK